MKTNSIWLDITTSMQWPGGVVGIVRAELEVAAALNRQFPELRFSMFSSGRFVEIDKRELLWLHGDQNVAERYLETRNQKGRQLAKLEAAEQSSKVDNYLSDLQAETPSRSLRLERALLLAASALPYRYQPAGLALSWLPRKVLAAAIRTNTWLRKILPSVPQQTPGATSAPAASAEPLSYPYKSGDLVVSLGWLDSGKEHFYTQVKEREPGVALAYMCYDTILLGESTHHLYRPQEEESFRTYFQWISENCDFILYGGRSPQRDGEYYQRKFGWPTPPSIAIPYGGTDLTKKAGERDDQQLLENIGIKGSFVLTVGTIEVRKNHDTLYKAYVSLIERGAENLPTMVFAGKPGWRTGDLIDTIKRDPRVAGKLLILSPSDAELDALYRNCLFTLLPSFYEGWSLPMPEGLSYGKLCLASDVEPLREIGGEFPDYIHPLDVMGWAERIEFYSNNPEALRERELNIRDNWTGTSWEKCGSDVLAAIQSFATIAQSRRSTNRLWVDLTLSYAVWRGGVTGIIRSELILAHHLEKLVPGVRFFAFHEGQYFEIPRERLHWLFEDSDVNKAYSNFQKFWSEKEALGEAHRIPNYSSISGSAGPAPVLQPHIPALAYLASPALSRRGRLKTAAAYFVSILPRALRDMAINYAKRSGNIPAHALTDEEYKRNQDASLGQGDVRIEAQALLDGAAQKLPFGRDDMVFSAGINWDPKPLSEIIKAKRQSPFHFAQIIYDLTPLNTPHLHAKEAFDWYQKFFYLAGLASDKIIYGGETAMIDGQKWQKDHGWDVIDGLPIKFGSDIAPHTDYSLDQQLLQEMGVTGPFILSVGTLEIRKNHETLYKAYLKLLEDGVENLPQMVFVGGPGWKAQDLFEVIMRDERVKGRLLILRTSDQQLDVLYRHCQFTLLSSLYEGWSLTLPESLGYGKFCLTSDVPPLRETGRDLVEFIHPWDVVRWADRIAFYSSNPDELKRREQRIQDEWHTITWKECAINLTGYFKQIAQGKSEDKA
ncbi:glycosyltransferase involved in cell wall biosynthesis [Pseudomonas nitritireducens]|uniref:Glycosyltransferase involved in cell wall biosynthesis n=1 Tax=Pseudomonas nitroreducens TaxID=46680 RepID=A0A7W7KJ02_PSENT|nr:glycosyltransferase [Pseudomonas nitritireducens]MBB4862998.1 glycosyltransferase involved in cell wall biosynthesis [Pseudomonas nitritireducens]